MARLVALEERFWLTEKGCAAVGGHRIHDDGACHTCIVCGADVDIDVAVTASRTAVAGDRGASDVQVIVIGMLLLCATAFLGLLVAIGGAR